jgi:hypothetical protein
MTAFSDMPDNFRMHIRAIIDDADGLVEGYYGPYVKDGAKC